MASTARDRHGDKTIEDWRALPEDHRFELIDGELIDGELIEKATPTFEHGHSQRRTGSAIGDTFDRRPGGPGGPGGWWTASEVDILLDGRVFRPDLLGWRRDRVPTPPRERRSRPAPTGSARSSATRTARPTRSRRSVATTSAASRTTGCSITSIER
jgi:Uma2 family endonuclease